MSKKVLWLEGNSGISGDMTVGALLDLGASEAYMREQLGRLALDGYEVQISREKKGGIEGCAFRVNIAKEQHQHRHYGDIVKLLSEAGLDDPVEELAQRMFYLVARAESQVHGEALEEVHFHEVGAVDSIVDLVASAACFVSLGIREAAVGPLREGCGTVQCQHGEIPVPVPAVSRIAAEWGLRLSFTETRGEMVTPTGAAIAAAIQTRERRPENCRILKIGVGTGEREFTHPNVLRVFLLEEEEEEQVFVLETNVDDCTGEQLGYVREQLEKKGALDVSLHSAAMKKNRPGYLLRAVCRAEQKEELEDCIFRETTTIGIRSFPAGRRVLERHMEEVMVDGIPVALKVCRLGEETYGYPEYETVKKAAETLGKPWREIYEQAVKKSMPTEKKAREQAMRHIEELLKKDCCVAFSGGADSGLLLSLARDAAVRQGTTVYAVTLVTALHPAADRETARRTAGELGVPYREIVVDELAQAGIGDNPPDRCYRCKRLLFEKLCELGRELNCGSVLEGTNGDDLKEYRPGLKAVRELGVVSPLAEAGLTKEEVRRWARERGLSISDRPASPCMATRIPYGEKITEEALHRIEKGETFLKELGFAQVRLRTHGDMARIEILPEQFGTLTELKKQVTEYLKKLGFSYLTMDLQGFRSGSMDEQLKGEKK